MPTKAELYAQMAEKVATQLTEVAGKLAEEYWTEHQQDFFYIVDGSFLEGVQQKKLYSILLQQELLMISKEQHRLQERW